MKCKRLPCYSPELQSLLYYKKKFKKEKKKKDICGQKKGKKNQKKSKMSKTRRKKIQTPVYVCGVSPQTAQCVKNNVEKHS